MAFGLSGDLERTQMIGGDAVVAWVDRDTLQGNAHDYYLDSKSQCAGTRGSCPDQRLEDGANSVRLLNAALVNGYSIITYQRPLRAKDHFDRPIFSNGTRQAIIWAVGPLNSRNEVSYHSAATRGNILFDFGRSPEWNCPLPETSNMTPDAHEIEEIEDTKVEAVTQEVTTRAPATPAPAATTNAWHIPPIQCYEPEDGVFYAQMGPTGGKRGYPAITGTKVQVFAGIKFDKRGKATPIGTGRLCNWTPDPDYPADESESFGAYQRTLRLECDPGEPGILRWTPDENTPDTVYYQCFTHRYLGWKINVVDSCDQSESASDNHNVEYEDEADAIEPEASIQVDTRVKANDKEESSYSVGDYEQDLSPPSAESTARRVTYITSLTSQAEAPKVQLVGVLESIKNDSVDATSVKKLFTPHDEASIVEDDNSYRTSEIQGSIDENNSTSIEGGRRNGDADDSSVEQESLFSSPKETETFEPMFIPSPVDRNIASNQPASINSLDNKHKTSFLRRPLTSPLLSPANRHRPLRRPAPYRNGQPQSHGMAPPPIQSNNFRRFPPKRPLNFGDTAAANERIDTYYLPRFPSRSLQVANPSENAGLVLTYDGRPVQDASLINPPSTEQLVEKPRGRSSSIRASQSLQATPQFGPFSGEIPPPVPNLVPENSNIPQLRRYSLNANSQVPSTDRSSDVVKSIVKRWADHEPGHTHDHHEEPQPEPEPSGDDDHSHHDHHENHSSKSNSPRTFVQGHFMTTFIIACVVLCRI
ncbi:hypothetical protein B566_EDAN008129 [Ephemera danica]|nr:hypothetical protein B566_EDAN008129 [Ephemera danica]